jgi:hypothetical protein
MDLQKLPSGKGGSYIFHTDKKRKEIPHIQEIQNGSGAKSHMRRGFLIYEEMRRYLVIIGEAVSHK